eukprot:1171678-Amphidinium_carterae.1
MDAKAKLLELGFASPAHLDGVMVSDIDTCGITSLPLRAFVKRCIKAVNVSAVITPQGAAAPAVAGAGVSASVTAALIQPTAVKQVNVNEKLVSAYLHGVPFHLLPDQSVWQQLDTENQAAKTAGRVAFSFVDLTAKEVLPLWVPPDAVGGKTVLPGEMEYTVQGSESTTSLSQLGKALQMATQAPRFFRSLAQWSSAYQRYSLMAEAMGQLSRAASEGHLHTILKIVEEERHSQGSFFLAVLYDDLLRRNFARRAQQHDATLNIESEVMQVDKSLLDVARHRLGATLMAAGLNRSASQHSVSTSLADDLSKKAMAAAASLQHHSDELAKRTQALMQSKHRQPAPHPTTHGRVPSQPQHSQMSNRKRKAQAWFQNRREKRGNAGGQRSGGQFQ